MANLTWQLIAGLVLLSIAVAAVKDSGKCTPVPNVIPTPNNYNLSQFLTGKPWYGYLTYNTDKGIAQQNPDDVNVANYYTSLGKSHEPTRTQESEIIQQEKRRYVNGSCVSTLEISQFTTDGRQFGPIVDVDAKGSIISEAYDESIIWSTDQKTYIMFFWCAEHNWQSGSCGSTHVYVYTRAKPSALTGDQKKSIATAVDKVLQPYCLQSSKFAQYKWDDKLKECPKPKYPDCFNHNVNAYKKLVTQTGVWVWKDTGKGPNGGEFVWQENQTGAFVWKDTGKGPNGGEFVWQENQ